MAHRADPARSDDHERLNHDRAAGVRSGASSPGVHSLKEGQKYVPHLTISATVW